MLAAGFSLLHGRPCSGGATGGSGRAATPWPDPAIARSLARHGLLLHTQGLPAGWGGSVPPNRAADRVAPPIWICGAPSLPLAGPAFTGGRHIFHTGLRSARERADRTSGTHAPRRSPPVRDRTSAQYGAWFGGPAGASARCSLPDRRAPFRQPIPALQGACFAASRGKGNATQPSAVPEFRSR